MVFKSRPLKRKTAPRRRRRPVRYAGKRIPASIPSLTHVFKRFGEQIVISNTGNGIPDIQGPTVAGWGIGTPTPDVFQGTSQFGITASFRLNQLLNFTEFTNLYDRYKIVGVKLKFMYQSATAQDQLVLGGTAPVTNNVLPVLDHTFDIDDDAMPLFRSTVQQHAYCKTQILQANQPFKKYLKPRTRAAQFVSQVDGVTSLGYGIGQKSLWIDCAASSLPHYGLKMWMSSWPYDASKTTQQAHGCLTIQPVFYVAFKDSQ